MLLQGCTYYLGKNQGQIAAFPVNVVDTTGAGDGFVAGFLHQCCLMGDRVLEDEIIAKEVLTYANAVGALTTTQSGAIAAQPYDKAVTDFIEGRNI